LNIDELSEGTYFLKVTTVNESIVRKIMKTH